MRDRIIRIGGGLFVLALLTVSVVHQVDDDEGYKWPPPVLPAVHEDSADPEAALRELRELREEIEALDRMGDELQRLQELDAQGKLWSA